MEAEPSALGLRTHYGIVERAAEIFSAGAKTSSVDTDSTKA